MRSVRRAAAYTVNPDLPSSRAVSAPMPEEAPVTRATLVLGMRILYSPVVCYLGTLPTAPAKVKARWSVNPPGSVNLAV